MSDRSTTSVHAQSPAGSPGDGRVEDAVNRLRSLRCIRPAAAEDSLQGMTPRWVAEPESATETAEILNLCDTTGLYVIVRGRGTKMGWGNPPRSLDVIV